MKEDQIAALAREYAEEATKADASDPNLSATDLNGIKHDVAEYAEEVIRFLLRRYCLVEKETVNKKYKSVKDTPDDCNYEEHGATWDAIPYLSRFYDEGYDCGQKNLLESLFPEIAKEVEE